MPDNSISKKYMDVLNLLGAKKINYRDFSLNLIFEKASRRRPCKWYSASLKSMLSAEQLDNISSWASEIIKKANEIRDSRRSGQENQSLNEYDYKLVAPVPDWTICLAACLYPYRDIAQYRVGLETSILYMDMSQLNERNYFSRRQRIDSKSSSCTEIAVIETMRQLKHCAEQFLGYSPNLKIWSKIQHKSQQRENSQRGIGRSEFEIN